MDGARTLDELQEKLDGVFDLNRADDCQKVIETLLRTVRDRDSVTQKAQDDLKMLALMVINDNPEVRTRARESVMGHSKGKVSVGEYILKMFTSMTDANGMTNKELISEVTGSIWGSLDMSSRESAILGELLFRTKKLIGMPVDKGLKGRKGGTKKCRTKAT